MTHPPRRRRHCRDAWLWPLVRHCPSGAKILIVVALILFLLMLLGVFAIA
ncbi:hypothetical protein QO034_21595 [Sedimentitalea sp. JM2-8]|uniref:Uncharacterized protein n=1 Tax=Sedimentitalea xiamensis TaxID=3050037 RepID=A0ABT7FL07_9RHOB|nr:hypothetical protein [Sedimentitalea xiamensis]MDK3075665.1 hypothetical protein [Sedimentitalea xiamensis]